MKGVSPCSCVRPQRPSPVSDPRFLKQQQDPHLGGHNVKETLELKAEPSAPAPQARRVGLPVSTPEPSVESVGSQTGQLSQGPPQSPELWGSWDRPRPPSRTAPSYPRMLGGGEGGLVVAAKVSLPNQSLPCSQGSPQDGALGSKV